MLHPSDLANVEQVKMAKRILLHTDGGGQTVGLVGADAMAVAHSL